LDDDADFVKAVGIVLKAYGYNVRTAPDVAECANRIKEKKPNLILLDVMMGHLDDGFRACHNMKIDPATEDIPIILVTAVSEKTGLRFSLEKHKEYMPADDYLEKPVTPEKLLQAVRKTIK
jgi:CheY-like chemotaxis protein